MKSEEFEKHFISRQKIYEEKSYTPMKIAREAWQAARGLDTKRIAELEEKAKIASELINYVMGADDYDTDYKDDDCIYIKHFKDLVSINSVGYVKATVFENLMFSIDNAKLSSNPFEFLCNQIQAIQNTEFSVKKRESYSELESQNKAMRDALKHADKFIGELNFSLDRDLMLRKIEQALALKKEG